MSVYAVINCAIDIPSSLEEGADGLLLPRTIVDEMTVSDWAECVALAAGKPLCLLSSPDINCLRQIVAQALPGQLTVFFSCEDHRASEQFKANLEAVSYELASEGMEPATLGVGYRVGSSAGEQCEDLVADDRLVVDAGGCDATTTHSELKECVNEALTIMHSDSDSGMRTLVVLGSSVDAVSHLAINVDSVAVPVGLIGVTKDLIRSFPLEAQM